MLRLSLETIELLAQTVADSDANQALKKRDSILERNKGRETSLEFYYFTGERTVDVGNPVDLGFFRVRESVKGSK